MSLDTRYESPRTLLGLLSERQLQARLSRSGTAVATSDDDNDSYETKARGESCKQEPDDEDDPGYRTLSRGERVGVGIL